MKASDGGLQTAWLASAPSQQLQGGACYKPIGRRRWWTTDLLQRAGAFQAPLFMRTERVWWAERGGLEMLERCGIVGCQGGWLCKISEGVGKIDYRFTVLEFHTRLCATKTDFFRLNSG